MAKIFRVVTNGVKYRVERKVERRFLWWKWTTWKQMCSHIGAFLGDVQVEYSVGEDAFAVCRKLQEQHDALHEWSEVNE